MTRSISTADTIDHAVDRGLDFVREQAGLAPRPPEIVHLGFLERPRVQERAYICVRTRRAYLARLECRQGDSVLYLGVAPRDGHVAVTPLTLEPILLRLDLEPQPSRAAGRNARVIAEAMIEPAPKGPPIENIEVPAEALLGEPFLFTWAAPEAHRVSIFESGSSTARPVAPVGEIPLKPDRLGRYTIHLVAEGRWGRSVATHAVQIVAPKLAVIALRGPKRTGFPATRCVSIGKSAARRMPGSPCRVTTSHGALDSTMP
jgi:hypothetical protein